MLRYLQAAFLASPEVPGLGKVPVNIVAMIVVVLLALLRARFWFLAFGLEMVFLFALALDERFQRLVDSQDLSGFIQQSEAKTRALVAQLGPEARGRLAALENKCEAIIGQQRDFGTDEFVVESNRDALRNLLEIYLKLLLARQRLLPADDFRATEEKLQRDVTAVESGLHNSRLSASARESKTATLHILHKRQENLARRERALEEIDSDLTRIEAHIDLALDYATLHDRPQTIATNITLASQLLDGDLYGTPDTGEPEVAEGQETPPQDADSTTTSTDKEQARE